MKRSRDKRECIVLLGFAVVATICTYFWASDYTGLPVIALTHFMLGFLLGGLSRRVRVRVSGWFVGSFLVTVGNAFPSGPFALLVFIVLFPFGLAVAGVGTLLGYFARPFIARWLIR